MAGENCNHKIDPLKLVREGTSQDERPFQALDPAFAPVDERTPAHGMVFAQSLAAFLHYFQLNNTIIGTWQPFFTQDVSVLLATAAVQNVDAYRQQIKAYFDFLNDLDNESKEPELKDRLGYLFSSIATLADQFDRLSQALPNTFPIKKTLENLIQTQLAPAFKKIMLYYRDGVVDRPAPAPPPIPPLTYLNEVVPPLEFRIFGKPVEKFKDIQDRGLSTNWIIADSATDWNTYKSNLNVFAQYPHTGIYGTGNTLFQRINHIVTHNLFRTTFDQFLKAYARIIQDAKVALEATFINYDQHQPHYALFLAFLRLMEHARSEMNTLTGRHLDFYYKEVLQLKEKPAEPGHAHLLVTLAKHATTHELKQNELFNAGKDGLGRDAFFANDRDFVANQAKVAALKTVYRHKKESNEDETIDRLFASPIANSADGLGEELTSIDKSWHPFFNKIYADGLLDDIKMPTAELGFAVSSYHLFLTEGYRIITLQFELNKPVVHLLLTAKIFITIEDDWYPLEKTFSISGSVANLSFSLNADAPAIRPYNAEIHGRGFATSDPVVKVLLSHSKILYDYKNWENIIVKKCEVSVSVGYSDEGNPDEPGLKSLQISNDFGQVDTSQPFQPFGAIPIKGASLIIGNKEVFQKSNVEIQLDLTWKDLPDDASNIDYDNVPGPIAPDVSLYRLLKSTWVKRSNLEIFKNIQAQVQVPEMDSIQLLVNPTISSFDYTPGEYYSVEKTSGYLKLALNADFGHKAWQEALTVHLLKVARRLIPADQALPKAPYTPLIEAISLRYSAKSAPIPLNSQSKSIGGAKFFHIYPFGIAEQHPDLSGNNETFLFPQFKHANTDDKKILAGQIVTHEAEFYIGITGLKPPQNLALLFQVADGTADPLSAKPVPHLHWSYLHHNNWTAFTKDQVEDQTGELTRSGIVTLAVPSNANNDNGLLPGGMHWIRIAVEKESDTVCHLQLVAAQALRATFHNQKNDPNFPSKVLPAGTIAKLDQPDADVKSIEQPFATFGGRGQEAPAVFYTRVSERLRHKDRSIALWDYERLVLEAFPQLYKVKCLNHTQYEPSESGNGVYRELAAGHVTLVTIPNQQFHNLKDPLKPYTSLGLLLEVEAFLKKRLSCFVKLHVKNPQFEEVQTQFQVRFFTGYDESFYTKKLQQEITRFLSPWAYGGANPSFGGKIYKSVLINFIEDRPYVDYITDFRLFHSYIDFSVSPSKKVSSGNLNEVEGSTAISIIVSVPESKHSIIVLPTAAEESAREKCPCES